MKIISWNVNGLRSAEDQFLNFVEKEQPDVLLLQEVRAHPDQLSMFVRFLNGYSVVFNPAEKSGYSGTAIYFKDTIGIQEVTPRTGHDILDFEGRTMIAQIGTTHIINSYMPNGTSGEERLKYKLRYYDTIKKYCEGLLTQGYYLVLGGDFNVAHSELDLYDPKRSAGFSGFLESERSWFDEMLGLGFVDTFRQNQPEGGHYTWWHMRDPRREQNKGWRFDYFLTSDNLKTKVHSSRILKDVFGSDHCPILLELSL